MYNINYIDGLITKEKYGNAFVRFLKILNFLVHLGIILILLMTLSAYISIENYNKKIDDTKRAIAEKRATNKIDEVEQEWEQLYCKLLAVKTQTKKHTYYAFIFRDLGLYLPKENTITDLSFDKNTSSLHMTLDKDVLKNLTSFYDYTPVLNAAFEKSGYLGHEVVIQDLEDPKISKVEIKALKVSIPLISRK